jgi:hypothetical protein
MANRAAWEKGWDIGSGKTSKEPGLDDKKSDASSGKRTLFDRILGSRKKGGRIHKTGLYRVHKGEYVIPAKRSTKKASRKRTATKH